MHPWILKNIQIDVDLEEWIDSWVKGGNSQNIGNKQIATKNKMETIDEKDEMK